MAQAPEASGLGPCGRRGKQGPDGFGISFERRWQEEQDSLALHWDGMV